MKKIIADSGCDLKSLEFADKDLAYERVALKINVGDKVFVDSPDLDIDGMVAEIRCTKAKTCSACPSPDDWLKAYEGADEIYVFNLSGTLSGSHNSAVLASKIYLESHPDCRIYIMDTLSIGGQMSFMVLKAKELLESGAEFETVVKVLQDYLQKTKVFFMLDNIDNLVNNGRMKRIAGIAVNVLGINIMVKPSDKGEVEVIGKTRGTGKCLQGLFKKMLEYGYEGGKILIGCYENSEAAEKMHQLISKHFPQAGIKICKMSGLCTYYSSISGLMIGFEHN
ncbi:MAG: DegV family protein [Bacillota bacterium]